MKKIDIIVEKLENAKDIYLPEYQTEGASGADVRAAEDTILEPNEVKAISTGLRLEIPYGYEIQVRPRSGLALKHKVTVLNAPGTIDSDYRGELKILLVNFGKENFFIKRGERIAQLVVSPVTKANFIEGKVNFDTKRNSGGFGSTGTS
jgi:dUTP pyrophosphatase